jgi:hypothetical protein
MDINYLAVLVCAILAMVLGFTWYGPLFGKKWMRISGLDNIDEARKKEMMKGVWKLYLAQFALVLFQLYVLAHFVLGWATVSGVHSSLWLWVGFVMPTVAMSCMWTNDSAKVAWTKFLIQAGYQLVAFIMFGLILGSWQ